MIQIKIKKSDSRSLIEIQGHANYADYGNDIVCAAISTAAIMTANLIEKLNLSYNIVDFVCEEGYFLLDIKIGDNTAMAVFENLEYTVDELQKQYPKYIKYKN